MIGPTIEDSLRRLKDRAAMLRYLADCAAAGHESASLETWSGIADACEDIQEIGAGVLQTARRWRRGKLTFGCIARHESHD